MRPTRKQIAIDEVEDIYGTRWLVAERRAIRHGFDLMLGWPNDAGQEAS